MGTHTIPPNVAATETRDVGDAVDLLSQAAALNRLIFMAGGNIEMREVSDAIATGSNVVDALIEEAKAILCEATAERRS